MQVVSKQLIESKDSLQFSNKSCEQLEARIEDLERTNGLLRKQTETLQIQLEQKTVRVQDLVEKLDSVQSEHQKLNDRFKNFELGQASAQESSAVPFGTKKKVSTCSCSEMVQSLSKDSTCSSVREQELLKSVEELKEKFRTTSYQKEKYEKDIQEILMENQSLARSLERAETDVLELQGRVRAYEEAFEKRSLDQSITSPVSHSYPVSLTLTAIGSILSPSEDCQSYSKTARIEGAIGASLFSELDSQYGDTRERYDQLVQQCTCSAGLAHRHRLKLAMSDGSDEPLSPLATRSDERTAGEPAPFKSLFEEVFATLKQTAAVADRLIERKKNNCV